MLTEQLLEELQFLNNLETEGTILSIQFSLK